MRFEGESKSEQYGAPLMTALDAWMHGRALEKPVQKWFPFSMPKPSVAPDFIDRAIARYERKRDAAFNEKYPVGGSVPTSEATGGDYSKYVWIGGKPIVVRRGKATFIEWTYMGEPFSVEVPTKGTPNAKEVEKAVKSLVSLNAYKDGTISDCDVSGNSEAVIPEWLFRAVRGKGLAKRI